MKKVIASVLSLALMISMVSCGNTDTNSSKSSKDTSQTSSNTAGSESVLTTESEDTTESKENTGGDIYVLKDYFDPSKFDASIFKGLYTTQGEFKPVTEKLDNYDATSAYFKSVSDSGSMMRFRVDRGGPDVSLTADISEYEDMITESRTNEYTDLIKQTFGDPSTIYMKSGAPEDLGYTLTDGSKLSGKTFEQYFLYWDYGFAILRGTFIGTADGTETGHVIEIDFTDKYDAILEEDLKRFADENYTLIGKELTIEK